MKKTLPILICLFFQISFGQKIDSLLKIYTPDFDGKITPLDTLYYSKNVIKTINGRGHDEIAFFKNGVIKSKTIEGSTRRWALDGKLEYESILIDNHFRIERTWYNNGQLKSKGTIHWGTNEKTNQGDWFNNNDWQYWNKKGKAIKK